MSATPDAASIKKLAQQYLSSEAFSNEQVRGSATLADPHLIVTPDGEPHSWLVGLVVADRLVALLQFLIDGSFMRYSTFQRRPGDLAHCPPARDWLDPATARDRVAARAAENETIGAPFLTFDRTPDRLVWAVRVTGVGGRERTLFVAGDSVYEPPASPTFG